MIPAEIVTDLEKFIEAEVERRIGDYPIRIKMDGRNMDIQHIDYTGGEINVALDWDNYVLEIRDEDDIKTTDEGQIVSLRRM